VSDRCCRRSGPECLDQLADLPQSDCGGRPVVLCKCVFPRPRAPSPIRRVVSDRLQSADFRTFPDRALELERRGSTRSSRYRQPRFGRWRPYLTVLHQLSLGMRDSCGGMILPSVVRTMNKTPDRLYSDPRPIGFGAERRGPRRHTPVGLAFRLASRHPWLMSELTWNNMFERVRYSRPARRDASGADRTRRSVPANGMRQFGRPSFSCRINARGNAAAPAAPWSRDR
jgi:hypothetical protein